MPYTSYQQAVIRSFKDESIHTAIVIDDQFPCLSDVLKGEAENFPDRNKALAIYETFKSKNIPCDIRNIVSEELSELDAVRKSDLVVLDYHLTGDPTNPAAAIKILSQLADNRHFNLVVVYTRSPDLSTVWLEVALMLRGGWDYKAELESRIPVIREIWDRLSDDRKIPDIPLHIVGAYINGGARGIIGQPDYERLRQEIEAENVPKAHVTTILEISIHYRMQARLQNSQFDWRAKTRDMVVSCGAIPWILCGDAFITFTQKRSEETEPFSASDPEGILDTLDRALADWNPNILQLVLSQIQNAIEDESLAHRQQSQLDSTNQAGWLYHLLVPSRGTLIKKDEAKFALQELIGRLLDSFGTAICQNSKVLTVGVEMLVEDVGDKLQSLTKNDQVLPVVNSLLRHRSSVSPETVLHSLNRYLSSETSLGPAVTTGTIFRVDGDQRLWVCASAACDLVPRLHSDQHSWLYDLHPLKPMTGLRLEKCAVGSALNEAEQGCHVFIVGSGGEPLAYKAVEPQSKHARPEMFMLKEGGRTISSDEDGVSKLFCEGFRCVKDDQSKPIFLPVQLEVVSQLRPAYANLLLQRAGNHSARIGVDFASFKAGAA